MEIKPQAVVIPKETDQLEQGKYGPIYPRTPACYGFTIISRVKPGRAEAIRGYGLNLAREVEAVATDGFSSARLHARDDREAVTRGRPGIDGAVFALLELVRLLRYDDSLWFDLHAGPPLLLRALELDRD